MKKKISGLLLLIVGLLLTGCQDSTTSAGTNAQLSNISLSTGTLSPPFSPQVSAYKVNLGLEVTSITITGTAADLSAEINGPVTLNNLEPDVTQTATIVVTAENGDKQEYKIEVTRKIGVETIEQARQRWMDAYNSGVDALIGMYTPENALLLSPSLNSYKGISEIKTYWDENHIQSSKIDSFKTLYVNTKRINTSFEIGTYVLDGKLYQYAVIWRINNNKWYRKVDAFNLKVTDTDISSEINNAEKKWEAAFNSGNAKTLSEVYSEDGILFHNISFYTGRSEIEKFWNPYMVGPKIILSPFYSVSVNENLAYHFGTSDFDNGEPYLMIWVKQNGKWLLRLDAWRI